MDTQELWESSLPGVLDPDLMTSPEPDSFHLARKRSGFDQYSTHHSCARAAEGTQSEGRRQQQSPVPNEAPGKKPSSSLLICLEAPQRQAPELLCELLSTQTWYIRGS
jgi:hypothetical protein